MMQKEEDMAAVLQGGIFSHASPLPEDNNPSHSFVAAAVEWTSHRKSTGAVKQKKEDI